MSSTETTTKANGDEDWNCACCSIFCGHAALKVSSRRVFCWISNLLLQGIRVSRCCKWRKIMCSLTTTSSVNSLLHFCKLNRSKQNLRPGKMLRIQTFELRDKVYAAARTPSLRGSRSAAHHKFNARNLTDHEAKPANNRRPSRLSSHQHPADGSSASRTAFEARVRHSEL